ncbi:hypothetical protein SYJ56_18795 [Algoriphagus sp. D3-2-R+10]|uniref:hypothetical protein n=1 Tax=Algoriphagus aurantiacus TaxID=3103948 RepID=UPI002B3ED18F|nr:hypothetical protein [Algoriphagus sp. D3-2-R+10]MEB2777370.1 hypothetical protein [Algoriphagus sp. D3-2-R+10]
MKGATTFFILIGLSLVGLTYYYSLLSKKLIEQENERADIEQVILENNLISMDDEIAALQHNNSDPYQYMELDKTQLETVTYCMEKFQGEGELSPVCATPILNLIENEIGELGSFLAVIGSSIDYATISYNYSFLNHLFRDDAPLSDRLYLVLLNRYRNPETLQNSFDNHRKNLFENIPASLYRKVFEKQVHEYLSAYEEIKGKPDKEAFFEDIYFKANSQNLHGKYSKYTFWKRRELEKNEETVLSILQEIKMHYNGLQ